MSALALQGIRLRSEAPGDYRTRCPKCDREKPDDALSVTIEADGSAVWVCWRCDWRGSTRDGGSTEYRPPRKPARAPAPDPRPSGLSPTATAILRAARPLTDDCPAATYLCTRGCAVPQHGVLWHPALRHWPTRLAFPALVSLVTNVVSGELQTLHLTFLELDGMGKAPVDKPKLLMPGHPKKGGCVRLCEDAEVTYGLAIAEGIETALAVARAFPHVWACLDKGNLADFPVLAGIDCLTVAVDHDKAGLEAWERVSTKWLAAGREVRRILAPKPGDDFNDWMAA